MKVLKDMLIPLCLSVMLLLACAGKSKQAPELELSLGHTNIVTSVAFSPDGKYALSGSRDQTLKLWEASTGRQIHTFSGHTKPVTSVAFSPDGLLAVSGSADYTIRLWDVRTGIQIRTFEAHQLFSMYLWSQAELVALPNIRRAEENKALDSENPSIQMTAKLEQQIRDRVIAGKNTLSQLSKGAISEHLRSAFEKNGIRLSDRATASPVESSMNRDQWMLTDKENKAMYFVGREKDRQGMERLHVYTGHKAGVASLAFGHKAGVTSVAFSPNGRYVLSGASDHTLRLWEIGTDREIRTFLGHKAGVTAVAFSPDGRYALSNSSDKTLKLWEVDTGMELRTCAGQTEPTSSVAFSPDGRYALCGVYVSEPSVQHPVKLWEIDTGHEVRSFASDERVASVGFSSDSRYALSGSTDGSVTVWDISADRSVHTLSGHAGKVTSAVFSPDGRYILSGSDDNALKLWLTETGRLVHEFSGHTPSVTFVAYSPDGRYTLTVSDDHTLKLWDLSVGKLIQSLSGHTDEVVSATFSTDSRYVMSNSLDGTIKLWDVATGDEVPGFSLSFRRDLNPLAGIRSAMLGNDDNLYGLKKKDWIFMLRNLESQLLSLSPYESQLLSLSPDGRYFVFRDYGSVYIWDLVTERKVTLIDKQNIGPVTFTPDSRYVLARGRDVLRMWEVVTGDSVDFGHVTYVDGNSGGLLEISSYAVSPDGRRALVSYSDGNLRLWEIATGKAVQTFGDTKAIDRVAGAVNVITDELRKFAKVPQNRHSDPLLTYQDEGWIFSVAFSLDGQYALSRETKTVRLWDVATGKLLHTLSGHTDAVTSAGFSPDGRHVLSGSKDNTSRIWSVENETEVAQLTSANESDYVIRLPDNYYTASKGALEDVTFQVGDSVFPFEQFDLKLNRPDIVLERLGKASPNTIALYKQLYQKRLQKMGFTEGMLSSDFHTPELSIRSKDIPVMPTSKLLSFEVHAKDSKYPLDRINVWINDVPVYGAAGIALRRPKTRSVKQEIQVQLVNGSNKIQVSALNVKGVESKKATFSVFYNDPSIQPNLYLLTIGVSRYKNARYNLDYAAKDAKDLAQLYQNEISSTGDFGKVHVLTITNEEATRDAIKDAKAFFQQSTVDDFAVLFVAGHGLVDEESNYYFGTHDVDFDNPKVHGLPYEELESLLDGIPCLKKLFLMDTCFSGEIDKTATEILASDASPTSTQQGSIRAKIFTNKRGFKAKQQLIQSLRDFHEGLFADLRRGTGAAIITASSGDEYSFESHTWKNGVFTYCVLQGLAENTADRNQDGRIVVSELQEYVVDQVQRLTKGGQHPTLRRTNLADDFLVYPSRTASRWEWQSVINSPRINDIYFVDSVTGWAAADFGFIMRTTNGDGSWEQIETQYGGSFYGIHFLNQDTGWVVGSRGTLMKTGDGGETWHFHRIPTKNTLYKIAFASADIGWIVGDKGAIFHTTDGGDHWEIQDSRTTHRLYGLAVLDNRHVYVAGENGTLLHTTNGGMMWQLHPLNPDYHLTSIAFPIKNRGFLVGRSGLLLETSNGKDWTRGQLDTDLDLMDIHFADARHGCIVGGSGHVWRTTNGRHWRKEGPEDRRYKTFITTNDSTVNTVFALTPQLNYAGGDSGLIIRSTTTSTAAIDPTQEKDQIQF